MAIRLRMSTPTEIKRTLARVANMALNKQIDSKTAHVIINACNSILGCIRIDEQQQKIDEIERMLEAMQK